MHPWSIVPSLYISLHIVRFEPVPAGSFFRKFIINPVNVTRSIRPDAKHHRPWGGNEFQMGWCGRGGGGGRGFDRYFGSGPTNLSKIIRKKGENEGVEGLRNLLEVDFFFSFPPPVRVITGRNNYYRVVNEEKRRARNFHDGVWRITKRWPLLSWSFHDRFGANSKQDVRKIERGDNRSITWRDKYY